MTPEPRDTARSLLRAEAADAVAVDQRIWATVRDLFLHPVRLIRAQMAGERQRYLPPLRLFVSLTGLYVLALSFAPKPPAVAAKLASDPAIVADNQRLAERGISAAVAEERRQSRMQTTAPVQVATCMLAALPLLWLMDRRRPLSEHFVFLFAMGNVLWVWGLALVPLAFVSYALNAVLVTLVTTVLMSVLFWKVYRRPSGLVTVAGLAGLLATQAAAMVLLLPPFARLVARSLFWF